MKKTFSLTKTHEWCYRADGFSVLVNCHRLGDMWIWKLYVALAEGHCLYNASNDIIHNIPLHRGCTYDRVISEVDNLSYSEESRRPHSYRKIGCDYAHYDDDHYGRLDPNLGLPCPIERDARYLYKHILERSKC